jgi:hypothetical protein
MRLYERSFEERCGVVLTRVEDDGMELQRDRAYSNYAF